MKGKIRKIVSLVLSFGLLFQQTGFAQIGAQLNIGSYLSSFSSGLAHERFRPVHMRYFSYNPSTDNFRLLLDKGDLGKGLSLKGAVPETRLKEEAKILLNYFLIGVSLPDDNFWVNLRPDSDKEVVGKGLENTDVGKILLEADLQLKKDTALFTSPKTAEGKEYWNRLYKRAAEIYGYDNVNIPTLTRPWIVPGEIIIRESEGSAYVYKATLKVMLEQDHLKNSAIYKFDDERSKELNDYSSQLIRELIIPKLTKEINSSKRYAALRQVYYSLILSRWFKLRFTGKSGSYASLINSGNISDLVSKDAWSKATYFKQYQKSFSDGEYNFKEPVNTPTGQVIRSYFSGGIDMIKGMGPASSPLSGGFTGNTALPPALLKEGTLLGGTPDGGLGPISASSPLSLDEKISPYLGELKGFNNRINRLFGATYEEANLLDPAMAKVAFDLSDKKDPNRLGWGISNVKWLLDNPQAVEEVLEDARLIREKYKYVIFAGMGGSGLSVQVVKDTFGEKEVRIYSLRTTDPQVIRDILDEIATREGSIEAALSQTLIIPISKSGTTEETVRHKEYFENLLTKYGIDKNEHIWVVTDKGSPFDTGVYKQREIQLNGKGDIGGRFTAPTTNIFLLPLAIVAPERVWDILRQTAEMNDIDDADKDQFIKLAAFLYHMANNERKDKVTMMMPEALKSLPIWMEQLVEESLGKDGKGITIFYGESLTTAEIKSPGQNDRVFFRINIGREKTNQGMWDYLVEQGYPVFEIDISDINKIGGVMLGLQRSVIAFASLWDICAVNQPKVEGYKKATRAVMSGVRPGEKVEIPKDWKFISFGELKLYYTPLIDAGIISEDQLQKEVADLGGFNMDDADAVYVAILRLLRRSGNFEAAEIMSYGRMTRNLKSSLEDARAKIFTKGIRIPSKLGEGPDKNHSFHQNIEGGKDMWLSTYFLADEIGQPEALEFNPNLLKAQAIGTVQALIASKRSVVLIGFNGTTEAAESDVKAFFDSVTRILKRNTSSSPLDEVNLGVSAERILTAYPELITLVQDRLNSELGSMATRSLNRARLADLITQFADLSDDVRDAVLTLIFQRINSDVRANLIVESSAVNQSFINISGKGNANLPEQSSSPINPGGIDFRLLPISIQPLGTFAGLKFMLPKLTQKELEKVNVEVEIREINKMVKAGILPSEERVKELVAACNQKGELGSCANELLLCFADICKLHEANASETSQSLREALVIVDSQAK